MSIANKAPAKSARHRARELALQGIYQWRLSGAEARQIEKQIREEPGLGKYDDAFFSALLSGVLKQTEDLEAALSPHLDRPVSELSPVECSILMLATYEMLLHPEIPYRVIINEAVELAKDFGGADGHKFVNGVLDKLAAKTRTVEVQNRTK